MIYGRERGNVIWVPRMVCVLQQYEAKLQQYNQIREEFISAFTRNLQGFQTIYSLIQERDIIQQENIKIINQICALVEKRDVVIGNLQRGNVFQGEYIQNSAFNVNDWRIIIIYLPSNTPIRR